MRFGPIFEIANQGRSEKSTDTGDGRNRRDFAGSRSRLAG